MIVASFKKNLWALMYPFMFKTRACLKIPSARNLIKHALDKHVPKLLILYHVNLPKLMLHSENTTTSPRRTQALLGIFWGSRCARGHGKAIAFPGVPLLPRERSRRDNPGNEVAWRKMESLLRWAFPCDCVFHSFPWSLRCEPDHI